jgi:hypothetical protein
MYLINESRFDRKDGKTFWITIFNQHGTVNVHVYGSDEKGNKLSGNVLRNYVIDFDNIGSAVNDAESEARSL